ncbi:MAG TPA: aminopeptidase [Gaiellaceae bacterium]|jgi:aminopeptidase|nr:aminopeptidase [Gaiellaceae bacterium]
MVDPRINRLADLIVEYSLELSPGQVFRIDAAEVASPLVLAMYKAAVRAGAHPYSALGLEGTLELLLEHGTDAQIEYIAPHYWDEIEEIDAIATVWSDTNTRALSRVDPTRHANYLAAQRKLHNRRWERIAAGEMKWCGTLFPTSAHAQDAGMSLASYEDFVFSACHVDTENAAAHWRLVAASLQARAEALGSAKELRIVGPDTDLRLSVAGRTWISAEGTYNMPDGEVFTSPVEDATEGEIRYTFPAIYHGREVEDIRLRFEGGKVVHAEAARGDDYLKTLLDMDEGARILGEVAFGLNYEIDRFTRNILFDEKIGGTMHLALGSAFSQAGGSNTSGLHWDMICDLREDGEVYADGELIWKAGQFLHEPLSESETVEAAERA